MNIDIKKIRRDFPALNQEINNHKIIYFDNAATTLKPSKMINSLKIFYETYNSNVNRGVHTLSQRSTEAFESTRSKIANLFNCDHEEVIFTKNDTESLNIITNGVTQLLRGENDYNILLTAQEHHSNIVPWQIALGQYAYTETNDSMVTNQESKIHYLDFNSDGYINLDDIKSKINKDTKVLSFTWASNFFGTVNPAAEIIKTARSINPNIIIIIDAAQSVPHIRFDFQKLDADFVTFSAHKLCGPTGVGVLIGKKELLYKIPPLLGGGDMIRDVNYIKTTFADLPNKFEAGTPNIADVIAFKESLEYIEELGVEKIKKYEEELTTHLLQNISNLPFVKIYGSPKPSASRLPLVSFNIEDIHAHDTGTLLDENGIAVRTGHHCTQLIIKKLGIPASVRASLYFYNTEEEIEKFIQALKEIQKTFNN